MKSILISIQPKRCERIVDGNKTIEVRKTKPKIDVPFKCYVYCTSIKNLPLSEYVEIHRHTGGAVDAWNGKVIGEFVCDDIIFADLDDKEVYYSYDFSHSEIEQMGLTYEQLGKYGNGKTLYGWHISNLIIYDKPKEIDEFLIFGKSNCNQKNCNNCWYLGIDGVCDIKNIGQPLFRPPQSWCYVGGGAEQ